MELTRTEAERLLTQELERARLAYREARKTTAISSAEGTEGRTMQEYLRALEEFTELVVRGNLPSRLKEKSQAAS